MKNLMLMILASTAAFTGNVALAKGALQKHTCTLHSNSKDFEFYGELELGHKVVYGGIQYLITQAVGDGGGAMDYELLPQEPDESGPFWINCGEDIAE